MNLYDLASLCSGANDATWATNKPYALQKSCDCPITIEPSPSPINKGKLFAFNDVCNHLEILIHSEFKSR